jgi:hypothetical protein
MSTILSLSGSKGELRPLASAGGYSEPFARKIYGIRTKYRLLMFV